MDPDTARNIIIKQIDIIITSYGERVIKMWQKDEVKEVREIRHRNRYRTRQMETFERLDTVPEDWEICDIDGFNTDGYPIFTPPFDFVFPFYEDLSLSDSEEYRNQEIKHCQLCGHIIKFQFPIQNEIKAICMFVGSECINNFKGAHHVKQKIKIYKENELRYEYMNWLGAARVQLNSMREYDSHRGYETMPEDHYKLYKKLKIDPSELTSRNIKFIYNKAEKLGIRTPVYYNLLQQIKQDKEEVDREIEKMSRERGRESKG